MTPECWRHGKQIDGTQIDSAVMAHALEWRAAAVAGVLRSCSF